MAKYRKNLGASVLLLSIQLITSGPLKGDTFTLTTAGIKEIQAAMEAGALTAEKLVELYIARIEAYDRTGPEIKSILSLSENALETARALDKEYKEFGPRSPLHGIPVLAKDVFDTNDMPTTGGYSPLKHVIPDRDSTIVQTIKEMALPQSVHL